jgi:hypothetical protein
MSINSGLKLCIDNFIRERDFHFCPGSRVGSRNRWTGDYLNFAPRRHPLQFRFHETSDVADSSARRRCLRWLVLLESFAKNFERADKRTFASGHNFFRTHA